MQRLTVFNGRLVPSYGSLRTNDGPHDLISLDLSNIDAGWVSAGTLLTEQSLMLRAFAGTLYVPYTDPRGGTDSPSNGQLARTTDLATVTVLTNVAPVPVHLFDTAITADGWFLFGATEVDSPAGSATILRSTDAGATWTVSLHIPSGTPTWDESRDTGARFYGVQQYSDGTLIANMLGAADPESRAYRWNPGGSSWTDVTDSATVNFDDSLQVGFTYQGTEFFLSLTHGYVCTRSENAAARATIQAALPTNVLDANVGDDGNLYVLRGESHQVWRGTPAGVWTLVLTLTDLLARSVAVYGGNVYYGTTDGRVCSVPIP